MVNKPQDIMPDLCPERFWFAVKLPMADLCLLFPVGVWLFPRSPADQITERAAPDKRGPSLEDTYDAGRFLSTGLQASRMSALERLHHRPSEFRWCVRKPCSRACLRKSLMLRVASSSATAASDKRGPSLEDTYDAGRFSGAPSDSRFPMARGNQWVQKHQNEAFAPTTNKMTRGESC